MNATIQTSDLGAVGLFRRTFAREPDGVFSAPGRVNLIGEHTDYTGGLVLPFAIDARANLAAARNEDNVIRVTSAQRPGAVTTVALDELTPDSPVAAEWAGYVVGAIWALRHADYPIGGFDLALDSQVPSGAGLSSSAAVECVTVLAASSLSGIELGPMEIARFAQSSENEFVGVPCGPMDQTASAASQAGSVLLFDTRAHSIENIPFDPAAEGLAVLVIDTRVAHSLADGEYGRRRASCEQAARILGVQWLRDVGIGELPNALAQLDSDELRRRVRHVVTENDRVLSTVRCLREGRVGEIGDLLTASHRSLRDDFEVSCAELDLAVDTTLSAGALGARMTGGGFGGSAIALVPVAKIQAVTEAVLNAFAAAGYTAPVPRLVGPAQGARREL
ncbi:MAG: galactokinase [Nakamurella sp.]